MSKATSDISVQATWRNENIFGQAGTFYYNSLNVKRNAEGHFDPKIFACAEDNKFLHLNRPELGTFFFSKMFFSKVDSRYTTEFTNNDKLKASFVEFLC